MGTVAYAGQVVEFDDRTPSHLQVVIFQKFRRGESFPMSWVDDRSIGGGRAALWLTPNVPTYLTFDGSRPPSIDQGGIDRLNRSAEGPRGLIVTDADGGLLHAVGAGHRPSVSHTVQR